MHKNSVLLISMGCSKNLIDTEKLAYKLNRIGFNCSFEKCNRKVDTVVINTCGFINDAKEESINMILKWAKQKTQGSIKHLFVFGCLSQLHKNELSTYIPEVDAWFGKFDENTLIQNISSTNCNPPDDAKWQWGRTLSGTKHCTYLKISEGCNRSCSFCSIPLIVGKLHSRPQEDILNEVKWLVKQGVKEINVVAQDTNAYGKDLYHTSSLPSLIEKIAKTQGVEWLRIHYLFPANFPTHLLQVINENPNICRYLDIPFQHCVDHILKDMNRGISSAQQDELIDKIRSTIPHIALRTTLMVGFPNETEDDFNNLLEWVKKNKFEHVGAFTYSHEEKTHSYKHFNDNVQPNVKLDRLNKLMATQESISDHLLSNKIGKNMKIIIDRLEKDYYVGRSEWDSPEVDNEILVKTNSPLQIGTFYNVTITNSISHDLYGIIKDN